MYKGSEWSVISENVMHSFLWALWTWHMMWKWVPRLSKPPSWRKIHYVPFKPLHHCLPLLQTSTDASTGARSWGSGLVIPQVTDTQKIQFICVYLKLFFLLRFFFLLPLERVLIVFIAVICCSVHISKTLSLYLCFMTIYFWQLLVFPNFENWKEYFNFCLAKLGVFILILISHRFAPAICS